MKAIPFFLFTLQAMMLPATADVKVRLSVKVILDASGSRPAGVLSTDAQIQALIAGSNAILSGAGLGYSFVLSEPVVNVPGHSEFFSPADPPDPDGMGPAVAPDARETHLNALDAASAADPAGYFRRANAVNCYFNARDYTAICSFPDSATGILLFGQGSFSSSLAHETGHFFNLLHTHQGDSGQKGQVPPQTLVPGNRDFCDDTEPDHNDWDLDDIAVALGYTSNAALLVSGDNALIGRSVRIWRNLMSYHDPAGRSYLSDDQMDRWMITANSSRSSVCSGRTWFVSTGGFDWFAPFAPAWAGLNAADPYRSFAFTAAHVTSSDDIILLRAGNYEAPAAQITTACTLRATRGPVTLTR